MMFSSKCIDMMRIGMKRSDIQIPSQARETLNEHPFHFADALDSIMISYQRSACFEARPGSVLGNLPQMIGYQDSQFISNCSAGSPCQWLFRDSTALDAYNRLEARNTTFRGAERPGSSDRKLWDCLLRAYSRARILLDSCTITDILTDSVSLHGSALTLYAASSGSNTLRNSLITRVMPADRLFAGDGILVITIPADTS